MEIAWAKAETTSSLKQFSRVFYEEGKDIEYKMVQH